MLVGAVGEDAEQEVRGGDGDMMLAARDIPGRAKASDARFAFALTPRVSRMAAKGVGSLPSCSHSIATGWWRRASHTQASRKARK